LIKDSHIIHQIKYVVLPQNIGRAKIRNRFIDFASYDYLLFLDSDTMPVSDNFIENYLKVIKKYPHIKVFCGGHIYKELKPERKYFLRWYYGKKRECNNFQKKNKNLYHSFKTANFLIDKKIFSDIKFDETLSQYGHEDTLFGYMLKKNNVNILHINNLVYHLDNTSNKQFISNTLVGIHNLVYIVSKVNDKEEFIHFVRLLNMADKIENLHLKWLVLLIYYILAPIIKLLLIQGFPSLLLFDFLKIGYVLKIKC